MKELRQPRKEPRKGSRINFLTRKHVSAPRLSSTEHSYDLDPPDRITLENSLSEGIGYLLFSLNN